MRIPPIPEGILLSVNELLAKVSSVARECNASGAIVVLFTDDEYKSFQFNCDDEDFIRARRVILAHKKLELVEH